MRYYPRIATCRFTGIKCVVYTAEEEHAFHRDGSRAFAVILGVYVSAFVAFIWLVM